MPSRYETDKPSSSDIRLVVSDVVLAWAATKVTTFKAWREVRVNIDIPFRENVIDG